MPIICQPPSLLELCHRKSVPLVYDLCCKIEKTYGDYKQGLCASTVSEVQHYLLDSLVSMLDGIGKQLVQRHMYFHSLQDCRILYALIIHKSMESLSILTGHSDSHAFSHFICTNVAQLTNLIHLDLSGIECNSTTIEIIGNTCKKLKSLILRMPGKYRSHMVTNSGFAVLSNLKNLRILKDSSGKQFETVDRAVIFNLLKTLKNLEEIDYYCIGEIIDEYVNEQYFNGQCNERVEGDDNHVKPLALTCVKIDRSFISFKVKPNEKFVVILGGPSPSIILSLAQACPNLNHLELLSFDTCSDVTRDEFIYNLASSSIRLSTLALDGFSVNDSFEHLLKKKGTNLKTFMFSPLQASRSHLQLLRQWCPAISDLRLTKSHYPDEDDCYGSSERTFSIVGGI